MLEPTQEFDRDDDVLFVESEKRKPNIAIVYGHHGINEAIAKKAAERLKHSQLSLNGNISFIPQPEGLDYTDAYEEVTQSIPSSSDDFRARYEAACIDRLKKGYERIEGLARSLPNTVFFDIHATPGGIELPSEGLLIHVSLAAEQIVQLTKALENILPHGAKRKLPCVITQNSDLVDIVTGDHRDHPINTVTVEILGDYSIYDPVDDLTGANISQWSKEAELHRLKSTKGLSKEDKYRLLSQIDVEVTKSARLLALVIPVIAQFYQNNTII